MPLTGSIILNNYINNGEYIRNSAINSDEEEYKPYNLNELNTFRKNNNIDLNLGDNYLNNKNKIDYEKKQKEGDFKIKYKNDKSKINNKENDSKTQKLYQSINFIFFHDYQQKYIKDQKINELKKDELKQQIFNDKIKGSNILKDYYMNYIETIILPLFKKKNNIITSKLEGIKYNISVILECLGMDINYYNNYYSSIETKKENDTNKSLSQEATLRFREEYQLSKEDYKDEALEKKLIENGLDPKKTFAKMFG